MAWLNLMYLSHTLLEIVLGCIKLRGRYHHQSPGAMDGRSKMYVRHHGFSLLALAMCSYFVWRHDLTKTATGEAVSSALALFHGGAVLSFTLAYAEGAIPFTKVMLPHAPYAVGFAAHTLRIL